LLLKCCLQWLELCREALILSELVRGNCPHVVDFLGPASNKKLTEGSVVDGYAPSDVQLYFIFERVNVNPDEYLGELTASRLQSVIRQLVQVTAYASSCVLGVFVSRGTHVRPSHAPTNLGSSIET
jgi:hypothetical protein